ncbi:MAG: acetylornithine deacetylase/succinyl-diaminopimelate desuccinylase family protein [Azospirillaceae bacterium]
MPATAIDLIHRLVEDRREEIVALTQALVRIPTINPPGDAYVPCAELLGDRLKTRGFAVEYVRGLDSPGDTDAYPRTNVIARWESGLPGPCVHFNGHIDVVEVGPGWTTDPFGGEIRDGKVFGRGTCDMKGGIAAAVVAVEALIDADVPLAGAIEISGTVDEETGGYGGVAYLAKRGYFSRPRVDHVIIPEPLNVDRVCLGHRGVWWAEVTTHGRIAHGSMPFLGDSAIRHMTAFLEKLEHELYPKLEKKTTAMPVVPAGARQSTLNINSLHGGLGEGHAGFPSAVVAHNCRTVLDRRYLIEESYDEVRGEIVDLLEALKRQRNDFRYDLKELFHVPPTLTSADQPVVKALAREIERLFGRPAEFICSPGTYDQKHVVRIGNLQDCVAYGPGILDLAHQPDEYVAIYDLVQSTKVMAVAAHHLLTGAVD